MEQEHPPHDRLALLGNYRLATGPEYKLNRLNDLAVGNTNEKLIDQDIQALEQSEGICGFF